VELGQVLQALPPLTDPRVLVGAGTGDDAAVFRIAPDRALVATVDFFTPIVDDPEAYGEIAAANALSDVYAMGATPLFALSILAFPRDKLGSGLLPKIVAAGAAKLAADGCPVVGGHSVDDPEPKFGYAITGEVHPDHIITNRGAQPGDRLYLSKRLGSGLAATAIKRGLCPDELVMEAVTIMRTTNRVESEVMRRFAHACTDVTGFGLMGHLANFQVGATIQMSRVPLMKGARKLAELDLFPDGSRRNHASLAGRVDWGGLPEVDQLILCDAQTSGGLLMAIPADKVKTFEAHSAARWIGEVTDDGRLRVSP
jgi:selenium donor protein